MNTASIPTRPATIAEAVAILTQTGKGEALIELAAAVQSATGRVCQTRKRAKLTLGLTIEPADKKAAEVDRVWVDYDIRTRLPDLPRSGTLMFVLADGRLSPTDPQQSFLAASARGIDAPDERARAREIAGTAMGETREIDRKALAAGDAREITCLEKR